MFFVPIFKSEETQLMMFEAAIYKGRAHGRTAGWEA